MVFWGWERGSWYCPGAWACTFIICTGNCWFMNEVLVRYGELRGDMEAGWPGMR